MPVAVIAVVQVGRMIKREPHTLDRNQTIGELVLNRLEFRYEAAELLAMFGIA